MDSTRIQRYQDHRINQLSNLINVILTITTLLIGILANDSSGVKTSVKMTLFFTLIFIFGAHVCRFFNFFYAEKREKLKKENNNESYEHPYKKRIPRLEKWTYTLVASSVIGFSVGIYLLI